MPRPKTICVKKIFSDKDIKLKEGNWFEESDIKYPIINSNTDVYRIDDEGNKHLLLKFRKNSNYDLKDLKIKAKLVSGLLDDWNPNGIEIKKINSLDKLSRKGSKYNFNLLKKNQIKNYNI